MDYDKLLNMATELGYQLMFSGAEIYRVEESVFRLLRAYGLEHPQVFAIPNALIVSVTTPQGHPITRMSRLPSHGTDLSIRPDFAWVCHGCGLFCAVVWRRLEGQCGCVLLRVDCGYLPDVWR